MSELTTILVVDDESEIRDMLEEYLSKQGFAVCTADGGAAMRQIVSTRKVDVVLLDIRMPGEDGLSLARYLREHAQVGIIMVTAAGEVVDRIVGLEMGADDYVTKPFNPRELVARIKSVLRRLGTASSQVSQGAAAPQRLRLGQCLLDLEAHKLFTLEGEEIPITAMEFDLLPSSWIWRTTVTGSPLTGVSTSALLACDVRSRLTPSSHKLLKPCAALAICLCHIQTDKGDEA
jgi:two-component system phosphate regulon response regulator OmpR